MIRLKRKSVEVGDIFQILTSVGVCYGQAINAHPEYGFIVAVFREFYPKNPKDYEAVAAHEPQFVTPFRLQEAVDRGLLSLVTNVPVHPRNRAFPVFRYREDAGGVPGAWRFWDGEKEWKIGRPLSEEEKGYPRLSLPDAPLLLKWIRDDYRVEKDYI